MPQEAYRRAQRSEIRQGILDAFASLLYVLLLIHKLCSGQPKIADTCAEGTAALVATTDNVHLLILLQLDLPQG